MEAMQADGGLTFAQSAFVEASDFLTAWPIAAVFLACVVLAPLGHWRDDVLKEFFGCFFLVLCQLSPGTWYGYSSFERVLYMCIGIAATGVLSGGASVNPSASLAMVALGHLSYPRFLCRVPAQLAGSLTAFLVSRRVSTALGLPMLRGPLWNSTAVPLAEAALDEAVATFLLVLAIMAMELFPPQALARRMGLICAVVLFNVSTFNRAGCAMNPMLGTAAATFAALVEGGRWALPSSSGHYLVFWAASFVGAVLATHAFRAIAGIPGFWRRLLLLEEAGKDKQQ